LVNGSVADVAAYAETVLIANSSSISLRPRKLS
jgi:hypothetical protein